MINKVLKKIPLLLICGAPLFFSGISTVTAAPIVFCYNGPGGDNTYGGAIDLVNDGCISGTARDYPGGGDGQYSNAGGGDPASSVREAITHATGVDPGVLSLYDKTDGGPVLTTLTGGTSTNSGTWDIIDNLIGISYVSIKAANSFSLFDVQGANSLAWSTIGILNNGGNQPNLSHISFWNPTDIPNGVPEPGVIGLLGLALLGLRFSRRRFAR